MGVRRKRLSKSEARRRRDLCAARNAIVAGGELVVFGGAPVRELKDMDADERRRLEDQYGCRIRER